MSYFPEFRNLFYHRIYSFRTFLKILCPPLSSLYLHTKEIGEGFYIQHGFSTIVGAKSIGKNCMINQQVTIGDNNDTGCPTILDNVSIRAGAMIIGNITIGNNCVIGANSTVIKDIPDNSTVFPPMANVMKWQ